MKMHEEINQQNYIIEKTHCKLTFGPSDPFLHNKVLYVFYFTLHNQLQCKDSKADTKNV